GRRDLHANGAHERNQQALTDYQQPGAAAILPGGNASQGLAGAAVDHLAADQVGLKELAGLERNALFDGHAHLGAVEALGIGNGVDTAELEDESFLVEPGVFHFKALAVSKQEDFFEPLVALGLWAQAKRR